MEREERSRTLGLHHFAETWGQQLSRLLPPGGAAILFDEGWNGTQVTLRLGAGHPVEDVVGHVPFEGVDWPIFSYLAPSDLPERALLSAVVNGTRPPLASLGQGIVECHLDLFREIGRCLEGRLPLVRSPSASHQPVLPPVVDGYERVIVSLLLSAHGLNNRVPRPVDWPDGKAFAVFLTHDVDRVVKSFQYATHAWRSLRHANFHGVRSQWRSLREKLRGQEPYWTFDRLIAGEARRGVKSTFFFLNETGRPGLRPRTWKLKLGRYDPASTEVATLIRSLASRGWEIGLHGSFGSAEDPALLTSEKQTLERLVGRPISGTRQHYFRLEGDLTWQAQQRAGLRYDTSVGSPRFPGFPRGTCVPYHPWPSGGSHPLDLWEIPTAIMDAAVLYEDLRNPRPRPDAAEITRQCVDLVRGCGGVLNVLWHPHILSDDDFPGGQEAYDQLLDLCKEENGWFATGSELLEWWQSRTTRIPPTVTKGGPGG